VQVNNRIVHLNNRIVQAFKSIVQDDNLNVSFNNWIKTGGNATVRKRVRLDVMKSIKLFTFIFILITAFSVLGFSQTVNSQIAAINTEAFGDKQTGIKEFVEAIKKLEIEFKPQFDELKLRTEKFQKLYKDVKEINNLNPMVDYGRGSSQRFPDKFEELKKSNAEIKEKTEQLKSAYEKRQSEVMPQLRIKIRGAIKQFAKDNGFVIILDSSQENNSVIIETKPIDVTQKFTEFYNKRQSETRP